MKKIKIFLFILLMSSLISCSKDEINPSGKLVKETRSLSNFSEIISSNGFNLTLTESDEIKLEIEADDNIIGEIDSYVENERLILKIKDNVDISDKKTVNIRLSAKLINKIQTTGGTSTTLINNPITANEFYYISSGGGNLSGNISCAKMKIEMSGGSKTNLSGSCTDLNFRISGGGKLTAFGLTCKNAIAKLSGGSVSEINASATINAIASGGSIIKYKGNPQIISQDLTGDSELLKVQ